MDEHGPAEDNLFRPVFRQVTRQRRKIGMRDHRLVAGACLEQRREHPARFAAAAHAAGTGQRLDHARRGIEPRQHLPFPRLAGLIDER